MMKNRRQMMYSAVMLFPPKGRSVTVFGREEKDVIGAISLVSKNLHEDPNRNLKKDSFGDRAIHIDTDMVMTGTVKKYVHQKSWKEASKILTIFAKQNENKNPVKVINVYREALNLDPKDTVARSMFAQFLGSEGRLEEMADQIKKALKIKPDSPGLVVSLGRVYYAQEKYEMASDYFNCGVRLRHNNPIFRIDRALNNIELGWFGSVREDANKLLVIDKAKHQKDVEMLMSMVESKNYLNGNASNVFTKRAALAVLADGYGHFHRLYQNVDTLEKIVDISPYDFNAQFKLTDAYRNVNQSKKAIGLLNDMVSKCSSIGNTPNADEFGTIVKESKKDVTAIAHGRLSIIYRELGEYDKAIEALLKVKEAGQDKISDAPLYEGLGQLYLESSRTAEAIGAYTKLIELEPEKAGHYLSRAMAYKRSENLMAAEKDLQKFKELFSKKLEDK